MKVNYSSSTRIHFISIFISTESLEPIASLDSRSHLYSRPYSDIPRARSVVYFLFTSFYQNNGSVLNGIWAN